MLQNFASGLEGTVRNANTPENTVMSVWSPMQCETYCEPIASCQSCSFDKPDAKLNNGNCVLYQFNGVEAGLRIDWGSSGIFFNNKYDDCYSGCSQFDLIFYMLLFSSGLSCSFSSPSNILLKLSILTPRSFVVVVNPPTRGTMKPFHLRCHWLITRESGIAQTREVLPLYIFWMADSPLGGNVKDCEIMCANSNLCVSWSWNSTATGSDDTYQIVPRVNCWHDRPGPDGCILEW